MSTYRINEVFVAPQGEGVRQGENSVFVRLSGCNMRCDIDPGEKSPGGFRCDTEFTSGRTLGLQKLGEWVDKMVEISGKGKPGWVVLTGGEPMLQVNEVLVDYLHRKGFKVQIETNGTLPVLESIDMISVSPKVAEHAIQQFTATEVKYVRGYGQSLPKTCIKAEHYWISPAFDSGTLHWETEAWCKKLIEGSKWKLSVQMHHKIGSR